MTSASSSKLGNLGARIVLGPLEHPSPLVVDDEERDSVDRVAARNRAADEVDHDVASAGTTKGNYFTVLSAKVTIGQLPL